MAEARTECVNEVDVDAIIREVMEEFGVSPADIPEEGPFEKKAFMKNLKRKSNWSKRYYRGHANGYFKCKSCGGHWTSYQASCIIDLKGQTLVMRFKQKCKKNHEEEGEATEGVDFTGILPCYRSRSKDKRSVRQMVKWAVELYLSLSGKKEKERKEGGKANRPPHISKLCEVCHMLGRRCNR